MAPLGREEGKDFFIIYIAALRVALVLAWLASSGVIAKTSL